MRSLISVLAALSQRVSRSMFAGSFNAGNPRSRTQYMIASIVVCGVTRTGAGVVFWTIMPRS